MYRLTLIMDDEAMAERLLNGGVLRFDVGFEHEAKVLHGGDEAPIVTTVLAGPDNEEDE